MPSVALGTRRQAASAGYRALVKAARRAIRRVTRAWRKAVLEGTPPWAKQAFGPAAKYADMLFLDHGIVRLFYLNRHRLGPQAWRSAQPAPHQIRKFAAKGVKTIVNLRGTSDTGSYWLEEAACRRHGITMIDFQVRSREAPTRAEIHAARRLFSEIEYPMMMHCKSGADRAGLMSTLYAHMRLGQPIEQARRQLSLRYGHIRQADTGVLDHVFDTYLADTKSNPMTFFEWVDKVYDPQKIHRTFAANSLANRLVNKVLRRE